MAIDPEFLRLEAGGFVFVQAVDTLGGKGDRIHVPAFDRRGEPLYAIPGGERLTEAQIRARLRGAA